LKQGFRLTRERTGGGVQTVEVVYGITSLPPERAGATTRLRIIRDHWTIENERHYVRDVTLGEDRCRVRSGAAPQVLAALRNAGLHLLNAVQAPSRPAALEYLQIYPDKARSLIGIPQAQ
jgi:hypothetical protein